MIMDTATRDKLLAQMRLKPSEAQLEILDDPSRYKLVAGGVRGGKSRLAGAYMTLKILESIANKTANPGDIYWLVAADYERTRAEFNYIGTDLGNLGLLGDMSKPINPGIIRLNTCVCGEARCNHEKIAIKTKSASDFKSLAMEAPAGIIGCEASQLDLESFWRLEERLVEKRGWLMLEGTFESSLGWYPEKYIHWSSPAVQKTENVKSFSLPTWTNTELFAGGREDPEIIKLENTHSEAWFMERFAGVPSPPKGRVHEMFRNEVHIQDVDFVEGVPVYVWVDPGYSRATDSAYAVEFAQMIDGQIRVFDEIYEQEKIGAEIVQIAMTRSWWNKADKYGAIDQAGAQHQAMPSQVEVWQEIAGLYLEPTYVRIIEGVERFNTFLKIDPITKEPKIIFSPDCKGIISELGGGPNPFNGQTKVYSWATDREGNVLGTTPRDRYNHAVKAITYGLIHEFGHAREISSGNPREPLISYW